MPDEKMKEILEAEEKLKQAIREGRLPESMLFRNVSTISILKIIQEPFGATPTTKLSLRARLWWRWFFFRHSAVGRFFRITIPKFWQRISYRQFLIWFASCSPIGLYLLRVHMGKKHAQYLKERNGEDT